MTQISLKATNADRVQQGLRTIGEAIPGITRWHVLAAMKEARDSYAGGEPGGYSVPLPNRPQRYERTGNLLASTWVEQRGMTATIVSEAYSKEGHPYSKFVLGDAAGQGQAWMHVGRWPLLAVVVRRWADTLLSEIRADLSRVIRAAGMGGEAGGL